MSTLYAYENYLRDRYVLGEPVRYMYGDLGGPNSGASASKPKQTVYGPDNKEYTYIDDPTSPNAGRYARRIGGDGGGKTVFLDEVQAEGPNQQVKQPQNVPIQAVAETNDVENDNNRSAKRESKDETGQHGSNVVPAVDEKPKRRPANKKQEPQRKISFDENASYEELVHKHYPDGKQVDLDDLGYIPPFRKDLITLPDIALAIESNYLTFFDNVPAPTSFNDNDVVVLQDPDGNKRRLTSSELFELIRERLEDNNPEEPYRQDENDIDYALSGYKWLKLPRELRQPVDSRNKTRQINRAVSEAIVVLNDFSEQIEAIARYDEIPQNLLTGLVDCYLGIEKTAPHHDEGVGPKKIFLRRVKNFLAGVSLAKFLADNEDSPAKGAAVRLVEDFLEAALSKTPERNFNTINEKAKELGFSPYGIVDVYNSFHTPADYRATKPSASGESQDHSNTKPDRTGETTKEPEESGAQFDDSGLGLPGKNDGSLKPGVAENKDAAYFIRRDVESPSGKPTEVNADDVAGQEKEESFWIRESRKPDEDVEPFVEEISKKLKQGAAYHANRGDVEKTKAHLEALKNFSEKWGLEFNQRFADNRLRIASRGGAAKENTASERDMPIDPVSRTTHPQDPRYYPIDEEQIRVANSITSHFAPPAGTETARYRRQVDEAIKAGELRKKEVDARYHAGIDKSVRRYAKNLADWINKKWKIVGSHGSSYVVGAGNYNVRKHDQKYRRLDAHNKSYAGVEELFENISRIGVPNAQQPVPEMKESIEKTEVPNSSVPGQQSEPVAAPAQEKPAKPRPERWTPIKSKMNDDDRRVVENTRKRINFGLGDFAWRLANAKEKKDWQKAKELTVLAAQRYLEQARRAYRSHGGADALAAFDASLSGEGLTVGQVRDRVVDKFRQLASMSVGDLHKYAGERLDEWEAFSQDAGLSSAKDKIALNRLLDKPHYAPNAVPHATPEKGKIYEVPIDSLNIDPSRFQFKQNTNAQGVTDDLEGAEFDPQQAGIIHVWRDPDDGKDYVVNGHHRFNLAKNSGYNGKVNVRYIDADTADDAKAFGAVVNIADSKGTATDVAEFIRARGSDDIRTPAGKKIATKNKLLAEGRVLAKLDEAIFRKLKNGLIDEKTARVIATELPDDKDKQLRLFADIERLGLDASQAQDRAWAYASIQGEKQQGSLFGDDAPMEYDVESRSKLIGEIKKNLSGAKRAAQAGGSNRNNEYWESQKLAANFDKDRAKQLSKTAGQTLDFFKDHIRLTGPMQNIIKEETDEYRKAIKSGQGAEKVVERAIERIKDVAQGGDGYVRRVEGLGLEYEDRLPSVESQQSGQVVEAKGEGKKSKPSRTSGESFRRGSTGEVLEAGGADRLSDGGNGRDNASVEEKTLKDKVSNGHNTTSDEHNVGVPPVEAAGAESASGLRHNNEPLSVSQTLGLTDAQIEGNAEDSYYSNIERTVSLLYPELSRSDVREHFDNIAFWLKNPYWRDKDQSIRYVRKIAEELHKIGGAERLLKFAEAFGLEPDSSGAPVESFVKALTGGAQSIRQQAKSEKVKEEYIRKRLSERSQEEKERQARQYEQRMLEELPKQYHRANEFARLFEKSAPDRSQERNLRDALEMAKSEHRINGAEGVDKLAHFFGFDIDLEGKSQEETIEEFRKKLQESDAFLNAKPLHPSDIQKRIAEEAKKSDIPESRVREELAKSKQPKTSPDSQKAAQSLRNLIQRVYDHDGLSEFIKTRAANAFGNTLSAPGETGFESTGEHDKHLFELADKLDEAKKKLEKAQERFDEKPDSEKLERAVDKAEDAANEIEDRLVKAVDDFIQLHGGKSKSNRPATVAKKETSGSARDPQKETSGSTRDPQKEDKPDWLKELDAQKNLRPVSRGKYNPYAKPYSWQEDAPNKTEDELRRLWRDVVDGGEDEDFNVDPQSPNFKINGRLGNEPLSLDELERFEQIRRERERRKAHGLSENFGARDLAGMRELLALIKGEDNPAPKRGPGRPGKQASKPSEEIAQEVQKSEIPKKQVSSKIAEALGVSSDASK